MRLFISITTALVFAVGALGADLAHAAPSDKKRGNVDKSSKAGKAPAIVPPKLKKFVAPKYPRDLLAKGLRGSVVLQLTLTKLGAVSKAEVIQSAGPLFDQAAIDAGQQLQFSPATVEGKPVPVAIRYRFRFRPEMRLDRRGRSRSLGRYQREEMIFAFEGFSSLTGVLVERGTGRPLVGTTVMIPKLNKDAITDPDGRFRFGVLPAGKHRLYVPGTDHKGLRTVVKVANAKTTEVVLRPERKSYTLYRATAEAPPQPGEVARRSLSVEEIQRVPGVYGDSFKVVQNLPGVARVGGGLLVVRGSAPQDTQMFIEGQKVQAFYHFGGLYSIINTDILEGVDFTAGGYPVRYGRGMGGVLTARLALPKEDRWRGYMESNAFHTGALIRGAITKDTHLAIAARRSYIDVILAAVVPDGVLPFSQAPKYYDWQLKLDHKINNKSTATFFAYGTQDGVKALIDQPPAAFPDIVGDIENQSGFTGLIGILRYDEKEWSSRTMAGLLFGGADIKIGNLATFKGSGVEMTLRQDFTFGRGPIQLRTGLDMYHVPYDLEGRGPVVAFTGERGLVGNPPGKGRVSFESNGAITMPGAYVDAVFKLSDALEVVPGVRIDLFRSLAAGETVSPRLNSRLQFDDKLTLKGATGMTSQPAQPPQYFKEFGTPGMLPAQSWETAVGFEYNFTDYLDLDAMVFFKKQWDLHVASPGLIPKPGHVFNNDGTGQIYGFEMLLRHKTHGPFFGWLSYTLQRATRIDHPGEVARLFGWDQTHIVTAVGSYKLPANWEVGLRFRLTSGNPFTPVDTAVYNEQNDTYLRVRSDCLNCARLPAFHQLDLRIDKKVVYDRWMFNFYLDIQNVYNRLNPTFMQYNFDATEKAYGVGLPIIPSLGVRAEF
jgi:TonB family protein